MPANTASGLPSSSANQMSPPSALLNSLKEVKGTTQRCSTPSHRFQCLLDVFRMLVVPESGSIRNSSLKSYDLPLASSLAARFLADSICANWDDGMPQRIMHSSSIPPLLATTGAL